MILLEIVIEELNEKSLEKAPEFHSFPHRCCYCLYWEKPELSMSESRGRKQKLLDTKREVVRNLRRELGNCGMLAFVAEKAVAYAFYARTEDLPGLLSYEGVVPDKKALFVACLYIPDIEFRGQGIADRLLERVKDHARESGYRALETIARRSNIESPSGPVEFYEKRGFSVVQDHGEFPLMRLDLD